MNSVMDLREAQTCILPSEVPTRSNPPSSAVVRDVIFVWLPLALPNLTEAIFVYFSFDQTSTIPNLDAENKKSVLMAMWWMSTPVDRDPTVVLLVSENVYHI